MSGRSQATTIDGFLEEMGPEQRAHIERWREIVHDLVPDATETISYAIPTFDLHGKHLVHFAGFPGHVSMYPVPHGPEDLVAAVEPYRKGKGTLRFELGKPLPEELIRRVILQLKTDLEARLR